MTSVTQNGTFARLAPHDPLHECAVLVFNANRSLDHASNATARLHWNARMFHTWICHRVRGLLSEGEKILLGPYAITKQQEVLHFTKADLAWAPLTITEPKDAMELLSYAPDIIEALHAWATERQVHIEEAIGSVKGGMWA